MPAAGGPACSQRTSSRLMRPLAEMVTLAVEEATLQSIDGLQGKVFDCNPCTSHRSAFDRANVRGNTAGVSVRADAEPWRGTASAGHRRPHGDYLAEQRGGEPAWVSSRPARPGTCFGPGWSRRGAVAGSGDDACRQQLPRASMPCWEDYSGRAQAGAAAHRRATAICVRHAHTRLVFVSSPRLWPLSTLPGAGHRRG